MRHDLEIFEAATRTGPGSTTDDKFDTTPKAAEG
jgi:hypothetical protein